MGLAGVTLGPITAAGEESSRHRPLEDLANLPGLQVELAYGTTQNCVGEPIYPPNARAWADARVAHALECASNTLGTEGYRLVILDAYRPPWAVLKLWTIGKDKRLDCRYLSDPNGRGSDHSRGAAVDVSLEGRDGSKVAMPCAFDHFGASAWQNYRGATPEAAAHRAALKNAMEAAGFRAHPCEWWHYVLPAAQANPIYDLDL